MPQILGNRRTVAAGESRGQPVPQEHGSAIGDSNGTEYAERFAAYLRGDPVASSALSADPTNGGLYLAPPEYAAGVAQALDDGNWFRKLCTVRPPTTQLEVVQTSRKSQASGIVWSEQLPAYDPGKQPTFGGYKLTPHFMSGEFEVSVTLASGANANQVIRNELVSAAGEVEEAAFVAGDGVQKPLGLFPVHEQGVPASRNYSVSLTSADDWVEAKLTLRSVYLRSPSLRWIMHPLAYQLARTLKTAGGEPLVIAGRGGMGPTIDGTLIELSDHAPIGTDTGNAYKTGDTLAMIGDLSAYDVQDGVNFGIARHLDGTYYRAGKVLYIFRRKVDGCPRIGEAFTRLVAS